MVQDYDIYYKTSPTSSSEYRVTDTAVPGIVANGFPDWLYEGNPGDFWKACKYNIKRKLE